MKNLRVAVIGGGAAGFFAALTCATASPDSKIFILEKSSKLLSKVRVSGGGRCNVTHACFNKSELSKYYPRGEKFLKEAFKRFMPQDIIQWFESRKVQLKTEADGRIFPVSDNSQTIIDCLMKETKKLGIEIKMQAEVQKIIPLQAGGFHLKMAGTSLLFCDKLIVATGGSPKESALDWLKNLGHSIEKPVPSLFTFNMPKNPICELMGLSLSQVRVKIQGTKLTEEGDLLITHWGMSGPVILRLSAWGARILQAMDYQFTGRICWHSDFTEKALRELFEQFKKEQPNKKTVNQNFVLPKRLWIFLLNKAKIDLEKKWGEMPKTEINRLIDVLINDGYEVSGKTTFKEEFVTCGGIKLQEIEVKTMESKIMPNIYFAGEVLDIDGITGGFNFQSAWTTAYIAGISAGIRIGELGN